LRELCKWKGVNIIESEVCPDHIHMLPDISPEMNVSSFTGVKEIPPARPWDIS
jgi:putative transposase